MADFKKEQYPIEGKGETDDVEWITSNGAHIPIKDGQTKKQAVEEHSAKPLKKTEKRGIVELSPEEYAEFCSTIKTRYANNIPARGGTFLANDYYRFAYNKQTEKIVCKAKISIVGNEEKIKAWEDYNV